MKLSCLPVSLFPDLISRKMSLFDWAYNARKIGLDAVDMSILFLHNRTRREILEAKNALTSAGMHVAMITTYPDFADPSLIQRRRELAHTCSDIAVAAELGASYVRITAGQVHTGDIYETLDHIVECFAACADFARESGVELVYENHWKPGAWDRLDFDFDTSVFLKLAEMTESLDIGINFDTANTLGFGDDPIPVFKKVFPQIKTIHVADIKEKGQMNYSEIGKGVAPIEEILRYAKESGFDGLLSIEEASMNGLDGIACAAATVRSIWERI